MGNLVFGMMQSLDGYVAGVDGGPPAILAPGDRLARHFHDHVRGLAGIVDDQPDWNAIERDFALAWRGKPKWVASHTLQAVGPNATLIRDDVGTFVRKLKKEVAGEIDVAGPELAGSLTAQGLIDEYRLYLRPFILGRGKPYFAGPRRPLHLVSTETVGEDTVRLTYTISNDFAT